MRQAGSRRENIFKKIKQNQQRNNKELKLTKQFEIIKYLSK